MRWSPHITVAAVLEKDNRFLLVQEKIDGLSVINQPAGHLEENESLLEATCREVFEETGWHYEPSALVGLYQWQNPKDRQTFLRFCFTGKLLEHDSSHKLDDCIEQVIWLTADEIAQRHHQLRSPLVSVCIQDYRNGNRVDLSLINRVK